MTMSSTTPRNEAPSMGGIPDEFLASDWGSLGSQFDLSGVEWASQLPPLAGVTGLSSPDAISSIPLFYLRSSEPVREPTERNEKRQRSQRSPVANAQDPVPGQAKEDHVHVLAKRGKSNNSHSLAERVRRENIAERMRVLQGLVPGCDKVTGKALMLDEIINYVLSLQRQVEFLSMKLAALESQQNADIASVRSMGFNPHGGMMQSRLVTPNTPSSMRHGFNPQGVLIQPQMVVTPNIPSPMQASGLLDHELSNVIQMGFVPIVSLSNTETHGIMNAHQSATNGSRHLTLNE